jgi:hypothetical protein
MHYEPVYWLHIAIGSVAVMLYWAALTAAKGSSRHRRCGRVFLLTLLGVLISVGGIFFASSRAFARAEFVEFGYLTLCVVTVGSTGWRALRWRGDVERFRDSGFRVLGAAAFVMGALLLGIGLVNGLIMPVIFSVIGLSFGGAMVRFAWMRATPHPNWALIWHLNAMCFLFNAVHGTLLAIVWKTFFAPGAGDEVNVVSQVATMAIALGLRLHYGRRFAAPLRLRAAVHGTGATVAPA